MHAQEAYDLCQPDDSPSLPSHMKTLTKVVEIIVTGHLLFVLNQSGLCVVFNLGRSLLVYPARCSMGTWKLCRLECSLGERHPRHCALQCAGHGACVAFSNGMVTGDP